MEDAKPLSTAEILSFSEINEDDRTMLIESSIEIFESFGFDMVRHEDRCYFTIEIPLQDTGSLLYQTCFWIDTVSMLSLDILVAGIPDEKPLESRYFKTMRRLERYFPTGIAVNSIDGCCRWEWHNIPLHPMVLTNTLKRIICLVEDQLGTFYDVFCRMDDNESDAVLAEYVKTLNTMLSQQPGSFRYQ